MAIPSKEHAKIRIEEFRTILKYMPFLQKNGLSDCGRGQIIGQMHLLQEFLNEKQVHEEIINTQQENSNINRISNSNSNSNSNIIAQDDATITDTVSSLPQFYEPTKQEISRSTNDTNSKDNTFDIDNLILEDDRTPNEENKLLGSRWLRPFKNDENEKKKPLDYFDKNEITQSWKEKIRKMTQSDII